MNINSVYANVRLAVPDATLVEMNKYLLAEIDAINASGIESIRKYKIVYPVGSGYGTVSERKHTQSFNYYPTEKCFILPSEVVLVEKIFYSGNQIKEMDTAQMVSETNYGYSYYITNTGEMYLSFDLADGETIIIMGSFGGHTTDTLPDKWIPYLSNSIIAGLVSHEYKDPDAYAVYSRKAMDSKAYTVSPATQTKYMRRNGRLY